MSAKIGSRVKLLAANIIQKLMPIEDGNEHVFYELCGIIAAHAPKQEPSVPGSKPRFDDIYYDGVAWLDKLDGV